MLSLFSPYQIYAISESWCSISVLDNEITIPGYSIFWKDRQSCGGGGVILVVHNSIQVRPIFSPQNLEIVAIEIRTPSPLI